MGYSIGVKLTAGGGVGLWTTQVEVSSEFTKGWQISSQTATTREIIYPMDQGDTCAATTVQIRGECEAELADALVVYQDPKGGPGIQYKNERVWTSGFLHMCDWPVTYRIKGVDMGSLCTYLKKRRIPLDMIMGTDSSGHEPWTIEGCMFR
ncbi:uncharacterized protein UV8b_01766 [Ustilaginoidea virens]|uniref:Uncharacterized protein n=1 Tax=Ustilaginoidea virens TaxID=1159556 RepID=A0A8E5HL83_USTVR|nr:uncharacterized protein UV8b_01766 [Ustilaginoidea virens]QUC17525.1 hypothetical protein UV8b_01766 [Ustilaginoidea virens]